MCDFESSFVYNDNVAGIKDRVEKKIPPNLQYACKYWSYHLCHACLDDDVLTSLTYICETHLLH